MSVANFEWLDFFKELADKLLQYRNNRRELILKAKNIYKIAGLKDPTLEGEGYEVTDMDPFTVFALFNRSPLSDANRNKIMKAVAKEFAISAPVPSSVDGVPFTNQHSATYYAFADTRKEGEIEDFWSIFEAALNYSQFQTQENEIKVSKYFDSILGRKHFTALGKLTMGLFWVSPEVFLSLDGLNVEYIYRSGRFPFKDQGIPKIGKNETRIPAKKYFEITEKVKNYLKSNESKIKDFKNLSYQAWLYSKIQYWTYSIVDGLPAWEELYRTGIMAIGWDELGDLKRFSSRNKIEREMVKTNISKEGATNNSHAVVDFVKNMRLDDIVYVRRGRQIVGLGIVKSDYIFDPTRDHCKSIRYVKWIENGEWEPAETKIAFKRLTNITKYPKFIKELEDTMKSGVNYYWVNQSGRKVHEYEEEKQHKAIIAPDNEDVSHKMLKELKVGDQILSYNSSAKQVGAVLTVIKRWAGKVIDNENKIYVEIKYQELKKPVTTQEIFENIKERNIDKGYKYGPFESERQRIRPKYCYKLSKEIFDLILELGGGPDTIPVPSRKAGGQNILLYGVPGSGKSWTIEHEYCKPESWVERIVFHPDYSYSDFVGQILPDVTDGGLVTYKFTPGPFTAILRDAYNHPTQEYVLVIEEINRGNAPAIFGDVFQLLDREIEQKIDNGEVCPAGTSRYSITNKCMAKEIYGDSEHKVRIPSNLVIVSTMNTSDQNVFTLDTAFQRRWTMRLVENTFDNVRRTLANAEILDTEVTWETFCTLINRLIVGNKAKLASAEDKRLGVYFVHENDLAYDERANSANDNLLAEYNALLRTEQQSGTTPKRLSDIREALKINRRFPEKVIKYLWDDAFKFTHQDLFDTGSFDNLEDIIKHFVFSSRRSRFDIFKPTVRDTLFQQKIEN